MADVADPDTSKKVPSHADEVLAVTTASDTEDAVVPLADAPAERSSESSSPTLEPVHTPAVQAPNNALAVRMARFKALQAQSASSKEANRKGWIAETKRGQGEDDELQKTTQKRDMAEYKLLKDGDPEFERKRAWDYTAEENEKWTNRVTKRQRNAHNNSFQDFRREANKVYKRQIKQLSGTDLEAYAASRAEKLQNQVSAGLLELVESDNGDVFTIDKQGRVNTPVEENYNCDHKPSKEAVDRLVGELEKGERARLKARAARGLKEDDGGDVTYINQKNKQFNEKLARFYNKYTSEIRESFERGTAI